MESKNGTFSEQNLTNFTVIDPTAETAINPTTETAINPLDETSTNLTAETTINPTVKTLINPLDETAINPTAETKINSPSSETSIYKENQIPKIVHNIIWEGTPYVTVQNNVHSWKAKNPEFQHIMWTPETVDHIVQKYYPQHFDSYTALSSNRKYTVAKYFIIHLLGGVIADVKLQPIKPLNYILERSWRNLEMAKDSKNLRESLDSDACSMMFQCSRVPLFNLIFDKGVKLSIHDDLFASVPRHPFWKALINRIPTRNSPGWMTGNLSDSYTCGSILLSTMYQEWEGHLPQVHLIQRNMVDPCSPQHTFQRATGVSLPCNTKNSLTLLDNRDKKSKRFIVILLAVASIFGVSGAVLIYNILRKKRILIHMNDDVHTNNRDLQVK